MWRNPCGHGVDGSVLEASVAEQFEVLLVNAQHIKLIHVGQFRELLLEVG